MDWQTSEPPLDQEIELETDRREIRRGVLAPAGQFGIGVNAQNAQARMRNQYIIKGGALEMFEVRRWRHID